MPQYKFIDKKAPKKVRGIKKMSTQQGDILVWLTPNKKKTKAMDKVTNYVVYCFAPGEKINLENSSNIVAITPNTFYHLPKGLSGKYTYVVTSLDRTQNESKGKKLKVKF